jgi:hypothetical protein
MSHESHFNTEVTEMRSFRSHTPTYLEQYILAHSSATCTIWPRFS